MDWGLCKVVRAGGVADEVVSQVDVMPTALALADLAIPDAVQGIDLSPSLTGDGEVYARDFHRMATTNRSFLTPHPWSVFWRHSHPPIVERIERATEAEAGP